MIWNAQKNNKLTTISIASVVVCEAMYYVRWNLYFKNYFADTRAVYMLVLLILLFSQIYGVIHILDAPLRLNKTIIACICILTLTVVSIDNLPLASEVIHFEERAKYISIAHITGELSDNKFEQQAHKLFGDLIKQSFVPTLNSK